MTQKKVSPQIAINKEVKLPLVNESLNPRDEGGNFYDTNNEPRLNRVPTLNERNTTGTKSKTPYQVRREGESVKE
jgi:hypothetical protein